MESSPRVSSVAGALARGRARAAVALARRRVPLGFAFGGIVMLLAAPTLVTLIVGSAVAVAGEALRFWAAGHLNKAREVTVSGPYRWFAHPLYVGLAVIGVGLAIACASVADAVLIAAYLIVTLTAAVTSEEAFLRRKFGDRYDRYRNGETAAPTEGRFSFALAMSNREYRAVVGLVVAVLLLSLAATYNEPFWRAAGTRIWRPGG